MEVSTEISQKIRSAIKAKLMELGAYVDDELPDYIMVMVANKKSRSQMSSDLGLFLGTNTEAFTGWLHGLLVKLQTITVESSDKTKAKIPKERKKDKKEGKEKKKSKKHSHSGSESSTSKKKTDLSDKSEPSQAKSKLLVNENVVETDTNKDINLKTKSQNEPVSSDNNGSSEIDSAKTINLQEDVEDVRQLLVTGTQADELAEELETTEEEVKKALSDDRISKLTGSSSSKEKEIAIPNASSSTSSRSRSPTPDKLNSQISATNRKRKIPLSVVASVSRKCDRDEEEYDPYNPAVGTVASVVKVTSRRSSVPASLQANRATEIKNCGDVQSIGEPPLKMFKVSEAVSLADIKQVLEDVIKKSQDNKDDITLFSKTVEAALRKLKAQHLPLAKLKIQEVLFEFETHETTNGSLEIMEECSGIDHEMICRHQGKETVAVTTQVIDMQNTGDTLGTINNDSVLISTCGPDQTLCQSHFKTLTTTKSHDDFELKKHSSDQMCSVSKRERHEDNSKPALAKDPEPVLCKSFDTQKVHFNNQFKALSRNTERLLAEDIVPQSPVSSSKIDSGSPCSVHSCPPSSTSGSDSLALRRCIVSTSTQSPLNSKNSQLTEARPLASASNSPDKSIPSIIIDSIHKRSRAGSIEPVSVLKQSGNRAKGLQGALSSDCEEESLRINPEALKVLAKNLKVTVINKRATQKMDQSSSEESSSGESDDEDSSDDEDDVNDYTNKEEINKLDNEGKV